MSTELNYPYPDLLDEYPQWLQTQGKSKNTVEQYIYALQGIPEDVEAYFSDPELRGAKLKFASYRSYLRFLCVKKKLLSRGELMDALDSLKPRKKRGNGHSEKKWSVPKSKWAIHVRRAPTQVAKMGIWLGFHFGLRLSEILHLRVQDINFKDNLILICIHEQTKTQIAWHPKYNKERQIPFTQKQADVLKRWITETRPMGLDHSYLLWTEKGYRKGSIVIKRTFQRWCMEAGLHPHVLRYSFATHWYEQTKDIKFVSDMLGHANVSTTSEYLQLGKKESLDKARKYFSEH